MREHHLQLEAERVALVRTGDEGGVIAAGGGSSSFVSSHTPGGAADLAIDRIGFSASDSRTGGPLESTNGCTHASVPTVMEDARCDPGCNPDNVASNRALDVVLTALSMR